MEMYDILSRESENTQDVYLYEVGEPLVRLRAFRPTHQAIATRVSEDEAVC